MASPSTVDNNHCYTSWGASQRHSLPYISSEQGPAHFHSDAGNYLLFLHFILQEQMDLRTGLGWLCAVPRLLSVTHLNFLKNGPMNDSATALLRDPSVRDKFLLLFQIVSCVVERRTNMQGSHNHYCHLRLCSITCFK